MCIRDRMSLTPQLIIGKTHHDERGSISFINELDLSPVKRFYSITPKDTSIVRAWQGHQKESKWFQVTSGEFLIRLVKVDNWETPSKDLVVEEFILSEKNPQVLYIPKGYANGFQSTKENSTLLVFSDTTLETSKNEDFRFNPNYWSNWL